ncbi:MAG: cytidylate kinase-like family protein [Lachnospiraceae bacterium]|nr:cytidylate kinase-like family protein [Lachnospiraceae bacterium]
MAEGKKYPVITISRLYAAGGRSVAKGLSEKLGIEYYDKDFVSLTAKSSGFSEEEVRRVGEDMSSGAWFLNSFVNTTSLYTSAHDAVFKAERDVVIELAAKGNCIIVGRGANVILREVGIPTFDIFLYADMEHRVKRAAELGQNGNIVLEKYIAKVDRYRNLYHKAYEGSDIGDYRNYNICLDTGRIGIDRCVDLLADILNS